jgi:hypothetical protein
MIMFFYIGRFMSNLIGETRHFNKLEYTKSITLKKIKFYLKKGCGLSHLLKLYSVQDFPYI